MDLFFQEGMVLAPFRPHAAEFKEMDDIVVMTEDVSLVTKWHGLVSIEHLCDGEVLKGFRLIGARHLRANIRTNFVPSLLLEALLFDLKSDQHTYSARALCELYIGPVRLLMQYPTTWWLDE